MHDHQCGTRQTIVGMVCSLCILLIVKIHLEFPRDHGTMECKDSLSYNIVSVLVGP